MIMALLALWLGRWSASDVVFFTHGLLLVAVAVVAQALGQLYRSQCKTALLSGTAWAALAILVLLSSPWTLPLLLLAGALIGAFEAPPTEPMVPAVRSGRRAGVAALLVFLVLAVLLPWLRSAASIPGVAWADAFYRTGSWVFGGGHIVLPWLNREVVGPGWVSADSFLAGYGAAQALPGPMFSVAAFLGTLVGGLPGALIALFAIFLPGFLLTGGVLPFWSRLRSRRRFRGAVTGASAVVVGLLASTLLSPVGRFCSTPVTGSWRQAFCFCSFKAAGRFGPWS